MKRTLDVALVVLTAPLVVLVLLVVALLVRLQLGSPVLFRQDRPGKNGQLFTMLKFRTMSDERDADGQLLSDEQRLSGFGRLLRATSLDELPELWNVLRGEMSLVGPRPLLAEYLPLYTKTQARRHEVCPGITGWAQVNGRNVITWSERLRLDVWYVDNQSVLLELSILLLTMAAVLKR